MELDVKLHDERNPLDAHRCLFQMLKVKKRKGEAGWREVSPKRAWLEVSLSTSPYGHSTSPYGQSDRRENQDHTTTEQIYFELDRGGKGEDQKKEIREQPRARGRWKASTIAQPSDL